MHLQLDSATLQLARGQLVRLEDAAGHVVSSHDGAVWITEDGQPRDIVLHQGESYRLTGDALVLVHALRDSRVSVS